jgi:undecaprenyl-diphosphatase
MDILTSIKKLDTEIFLFCNSKHNEFFDTVMSLASGKYLWIPLYIFFFYLVLKTVGKRIWLVVIAAALLIVASDQISVHLFKNVFLRYRPCHNLLIQQLVHVNGNCGGTYGFISSHACNTFALAMFLTLFFKDKIRYFGVFVFLWAGFVSYSRVYNGVHYPADIAVGALVGMLIALVIFKLYQLADSKYTTIPYGSGTSTTNFREKK